MAETSGDRPSPIRSGFEILPPNVTPLQKGAEPQNPGKRSFLRKAAILAGGLAVALGMGKVSGYAANSLSEQLNTLPKPDLDSTEEREKRNRNIRANGLPTNKGPQNYDAFTLEQMAKIKDQNANDKIPPIPSPIPKK